MDTQLMWDYMRALAVKGTVVLDTTIFPVVHAYTGFNGTADDSIRYTFEGFPDGTGGGTFDGKLLAAISLHLTHTVTYAMLILFYVSIHNLGLFEQYRIQKEKYPSTKQLLVSYVKIVINHGLVGLVMLYLVHGRIFQYFGQLDKVCAPTVPSVTVAGPQIVVCCLMFDFGFYWSHRALHSKYFYKRVHKVHHSYTVNHPIASEHAHVLETIFGNALPASLPFFLLGGGMHGSTIALFLTLQTYESTDAHSGYSLPFSPVNWIRDARRHDFHHSHGGGPEGICKGGIYGAWTPFWDWLCGTDVAYNQFVTNSNIHVDTKEKST